MEALYIEDDLVQQRLMSLYFENIGIKLHLAGSGTDGLAIAKKVLPSFIMTDWFLPDLEGPSLLEHFKEDPRLKLKHIPIIIVTAAPLIHQNSDIFSLGAAACLIKPISKSQIVDVLQQILPNWASGIP